MATPAEIIAQLEAALGTGTAEVEYQGRRVRYSTEPQIRAAIGYFQRKLANPEGAAGAPTPASGLRTSFAAFSSD